MRKLYWLIQATFNPVYNDEYRRLGEGEYLAKHGIGNEVDDTVKIIQSEAVIKLQKHLKHI